MRSTQILRHVPLIKFVGGKHQFLASNNAITAHPDSHGLLPGSADAIKVSSLLKPKPAARKPLKQVQILKASNKPFDFTSVAELPKRFQSPIFEAIEIDAVNYGGASTLI
ncbi:hypothetical protein WICMUC_000989 [Wickerhamomyces mucosus]|uniref:Uncharacterized protein n=1 Tax=Wickerhamomyces mucosus TaxID=1378264 RepID=A0A9P8THX1_9ASCO|nr:hypothetical protein WICMUC_000989 [Wickerhamomyces mucosus]